MNNIVNIKPVIVADAPDAHQVWLDIGVQHFTIGEYCETKDEAEWLAAQLRIALTTLQSGAGDGVALSAISLGLQNFYDSQSNLHEGSNNTHSAKLIHVNEAMQFILQADAAIDNAQATEGK